jgi:hypothetical protein
MNNEVMSLKQHLSDLRSKRDGVQKEIDAIESKLMYSGCEVFLSSRILTEVSWSLSICFWNNRYSFSLESLYNKEKCSSDIINEVLPFLCDDLLLEANDSLCAKVREHDWKVLISYTEEKVHDPQEFNVIDNFVNFLKKYNITIWEDSYKYDVDYAKGELENKQKADALVKEIKRLSENR